MCDLLGELETVHAGHQPVGDHQMKGPAVICSRAQYIQRRARTVGCRRRHLPAGEDLGKDEPVRRIVLDDEREHIEHPIELLRVELIQAERNPQMRDRR